MTRLAALLAAGLAAGALVAAGGLLAATTLPGGSAITRPVAAPARPSVPVTTSRTAPAANGRHWWEGYFVPTGNPVGVEATLRVPRVVAVGPEGTALWVGIAGVNGRGLDQAGVWLYRGREPQAWATDCGALHCTPQYPPARDRVRVGDTLRFTVVPDELGQRNTWTATIDDLTAHWSWTRPLNQPVPANSEVQVVTEWGPAVFAHGGYNWQSVLVESPSGRWAPAVATTGMPALGTGERADRGWTRGSGCLRLTNPRTMAFADCLPRPPAPTIRVVGPDTAPRTGSVRLAITDNAKTAEWVAVCGLSLGPPTTVRHLAGGQSAVVVESLATGPVHRVWHAEMIPGPDSRCHPGGTWTDPTSTPVFTTTS